MRRPGTRRAESFRLARAAAIVLVLGPAASAAPAVAAPPGRPTTPATTPRLVVLLVVDQFRADYLRRFRDRLGPDGFARLLRDGATFETCAYPYALTETSPGHATIATGTTPDRHGIVSNEWYDRAAGKVVLSVEDVEAPLLGASAPQPGCSPRRMIGDTLADEMRLATQGRGKSYGIAVKARASILATGRSASGAYWYDETSGRIVTSRYYGAELPDWVTAFNGRRPADRSYGHDWTVDGRTVVALGGPAGTPGRAYYEALPSTPFVHDLLFDFAREIVERRGLGDDDAPDFLFIGLSGHDYLGHEVGPYSAAVAEMTARTDAQLAAFLRFLDDRVGRGRYLLALTSDHGVGPTLGQGEAGGVAPRDIDADRIDKAMERALAESYDAAGALHLHGLGFEAWLDPTELRRHHATLADAVRVAGEAARSVDGVLGFVASGGETDLDRATAEAYRLSTYPGRSPDLFLVPAPFAAEARLAPANHGTPWRYDTEVPLILYGPPFRPMTSREDCTPADLAPTLAAALGIPPPAMATGHVLERAFR